MAATYSDLYIDQGADYAVSIETASLGDFAAGEEPFDISGYELFGSMKKSYGSTVETPFTFDLTDAASGMLYARLSSAVTLLLRPGRYVYDIFARNSTTGVIQKLLEGMAEVSPRATSIPQ
jgi:hypothetical protein